MSVADYEHVWYIVFGGYDSVGQIIPIFAHTEEEVGKYIKSNDKIMFALAEYYLPEYCPPTSPVGLKQYDLCGALQIKFRKKDIPAYNPKKFEMPDGTYIPFDINNGTHKRMVRASFKKFLDKNIIHRVFAYDKAGEGIFVSVE